MPLGQQPQQLHRDSSAGVPDLTSNVLPHDAHNSSNMPSSNDNAGSPSKGWTQRSHSEQLRPHLSPKLPGEAVASGATGLGSRSNKGAAVEGSGGGGDAESHHVVMSSGALLHHLGASSHQRTSGD